MLFLRQWSLTALQILNHDRQQEFINKLINEEAAPRLDQAVDIVHEGARPHLQTIILDEHTDRFSIHTSYHLTVRSWILWSKFSSIA